MLKRANNLACQVLYNFIDLRQNLIAVNLHHISQVVSVVTKGKTTTASPTTRWNLSLLSSSLEWVQIHSLG